MRSRGRHLRHRRRPPAFPVVVGGLLVGVAAFGMARALPPPPAAPTEAAPALSSSPATTAPPPSHTAGTSSPAPAGTARSTTTSPAPRSFTMAFTGDVLIHGGVRAAAAAHGEASGRDHDFRPLLEPIRSIVEQADWAVCHLEVNLSDDNQGLSGYPRFLAPRELASDLVDVGYDSCSTASNHSLDHGVDGVAETIEVMTDAGLGFSGTARDEDEEQRSRWFRVGGASVAHLSYAYGFNGLAVPADAPWTVRQIDADRILSDATRMREEGAELVVVSLHWGDEYAHEPNTQQRELAPRLLASPDIDLLVGHHAHVVQPIEQFGEEWAIYGLGNLLANQSGDARRDELLVLADVREQADGTLAVAELTAVPLHLDPTTHTAYPSGPALRDPEGPSAEVLDASYARVLDILGARQGSQEVRVWG